MKHTIILLLAFQAALLAGCGGHAGDEHEHDHAHEAHAEEDHADEMPRGEHGGRRLEQDGFTVELAIAEDGAAPRYQAWLYRGGKPLPPSAGSVEVSVERLGNVKEMHRLVPQPDGSLLSSTEVHEPHSFDVQVNALIEGRQLQWGFPSYEGRTRIDAAIAQTAGIRTRPAGGAVIADEHFVQGLLTPIEGRVARVAARYPGPIRQLSVDVGDRVRRGQVLAVVESNLSLADYTITAPIAGVVMARNGTLGAIAREDMALYEIADLSQLWVDLHLFGSDAQHITSGVPVEVTRLSDGAVASTRIARVLPGAATASQSTVARATLDNTDGLWRTGSAVGARITVEQHPAALAVPLSALQTLGDQDVVFILVGDTYEARPVQLGRRDARQVEVLDGIQPGDEVVIEQSYLVKADIEKSGASHEH